MTFIPDLDSTAVAELLPALVIFGCAVVAIVGIALRARKKKK